MEILNGSSLEILIAPFSAMIISQLIKVVRGRRGWRLAWAEINKYGGMPSSHTALFIALPLSVGLVMGFTSPLFFVTSFVSLTFIRDAVGIRWSLGFHGKMLNKLIDELSPEEQKDYPKHLEERLGHTPREAMVGGILGLCVALLTHACFLMV